MEENTDEREFFEKQWGVPIATQSLPLYLYPLESRTIHVAYTPFAASASSGFLYIRQVNLREREREYIKTYDLNAITLLHVITYIWWFFRNNMTILEVVRMIGRGASAQFRFGNRKPGSTTPLLFELADKHLKDCERMYVSLLLQCKR